MFFIKKKNRLLSTEKYDGEHIPCHHMQPVQETKVMKNKVVPMLFVAERFDGVEVGRLFRRIPSEEYSGKRTYRKREQYTPRLYEYRPVCYRLDYETCSAAQYHPDDSARYAD